MRRSLLAAFVLLLATCGCRQKEKTMQSLSSIDRSINPFYKKSLLPLQAPAFDKIKDSDFEPAFEEGMRQQAVEIEKIAGNPESPTFDNTLSALEQSGQLLTRVYNVFNLLNNANTNAVLQKIDEKEAPALAANQDAIYLNIKLFSRVACLYKQRDSLHLTPEQQHLLGYYYQQFQMAGAALDSATRESLKALNKEEAFIISKFTARLMAANKASSVLISDKSALAGLSDEDLAALADNAKVNGKPGQWRIALQHTTQQPLLKSIANRDTRQQLFIASFDRTSKADSNDTRAFMIRLARIRATKASLLGFKSYAQWRLQDQMARTPEAVMQFLQRLIPRAAAKAKEEAKEIGLVMRLESPGVPLQPWDWSYYAEKLRKKKYDLDEAGVKPYFELNKVLIDGVFYAAGQLYGLSFKERKDLPVYHPDVRVFDVFDSNGLVRGIFYCDYFKRDNKGGGAWMNSLVGQSYLLNNLPVVYNICNFMKPAPGQPALLSFSDVVTMFHEFGHALHGLFASQTYPSLASPNTARDFVEFPSQFNEHWAMDSLVVYHYAVHYKTGKRIPHELVERIKRSSTFNQGYALTEALEDDVIDMAWHTLKDDNGPLDADKEEAAALQKYGLYLPAVPPRYRSSYFKHIWTDGYPSAYYAYVWSEMLADEAFEWFEQHGGLTRQNGNRFREAILSKGNTQDYGLMFSQFTGHAPHIGPLLKSRGL